MKHQPHMHLSSSFQVSWLEQSTSYPEGYCNELRFHPFSVSSFPSAKISKSSDPKPTTDTSGSPYTNMPLTLRSLQERNDALEGQSHDIFTKNVFSGIAACLRNASQRV